MSLATVQSKDELYWCIDQSICSWQPIFFISAILFSYVRVICYLVEPALYSRICLCKHASLQWNIANRKQTRYKPFGNPKQTQCKKKSFRHQHNCAGNSKRLCGGTEKYARSRLKIYIGIEDAFHPEMRNIYVTLTLPPHYHLFVHQILYELLNDQRIVES